MRPCILNFAACMISLSVSGIEPVNPQSVMRMLEQKGIGYRSVSADTNGCLIVNLSGGNVNDLAVLKGLPISVLSLRETEVCDLAPLSGMHLIVLDISVTLVSNLTPLAGMDLRMLNCGLTRVERLEPLRGMPLSVLVLEDTPIVSLDPLSKAPLRSLDISGTEVHDLTCLKKMSLDALRFSPDRIRTGMDIVRRMKSLKDIGVLCEVLSAEVFWERYDKGEFRTVNSKVPYTPAMLETLNRFKEDGVLKEKDVEEVLKSIKVNDTETVSRVTTNALPRGR